MSDVTTIKNGINFASGIGTSIRPIVRLLNSSCLWAEELAQKTHFVFLGLELDAGALSRSFFKPIDSSIYVIKGASGWVNFDKKSWTVLKECWDGEKEDRIFEAIAAVQHGVKTIADTAAGLRFLASIGLLTVLAPYSRGLTLIKSGFAAIASVLKITCLVYDLLQVVKVPIKHEEDLRRQQLAWLDDMLQIAIQIFAFLINAFGGCSTLFKDIIPREKLIPAVLFNIWGTGASFAGLGKIAVDYFKEPSPK